MTNNSTHGAEGSQMLAEPAASAGSEGLKLSGPLTVNNAEELRARVLDYVRNTRPATLDLAAVDACDCAGLELLFAARNSAQALGNSLRIQAVPPPVLDLAKNLGVDLNALSRNSAA